MRARLRESSARPIDCPTTSPSVKHDIPHDLSMDSAKKAAKKAVEAYGARFADYDFSANWKSETMVDLGFSVAGKRLDGSMEVKTSCLALELDVPFLFRPFRGKAIQIIEREARVWIDKAKTGEI